MYGRPQFRMIQPLLYNKITKMRGNITISEENQTLSPPAVSRHSYKSLPTPFLTRFSTPILSNTNTNDTNSFTNYINTNTNINTRCNTNTNTKSIINSLDHQLYTSNGSEFYQFYYTNRLNLLTSNN